jgi:hypothetical protein
MKTANFVQQTTTSIAGTSGNGAVTMTAISGYPTFTAALGSATRTVVYVMEQTSTHQMEKGMGSVSSAGVLTRTRPQVTWDGTTFKDGSSGAVTALAFGSTPTAGDVVIRLTPTAEQMFPALHSRSVLSTGDSWRDYPLSMHLNASNSGQTWTMATGSQYYTLYRMDMAGLLSGIQIEVFGTAVNPSNVKLGLYEIGPDGMPGNLIVAFNTISTNTTGIKADTATATWSTGGPVWVTPGWYAVGFIADAAVPVRGSAMAAVTQYASPFGRVNGYGQGYGVLVSQAYTSGLQAAFSGTPTIATNNYAGVWIGLKVTP